MISLEMINIEMIVKVWLEKININHTRTEITKILSAMRSKKAPNSDSIPYLLAKNPSKKSVIEEMKNKIAANK